MRLIKAYNHFIDAYIKEHIQIFNPVEWIECNLKSMGEPIELSHLQHHIVASETSLLNRHIPRRRGKTFAVLCSAIYKAKVLGQSCLYVAPSTSCARMAKQKVIELLRASDIVHIQATDYVRIDEGNIYFTTANAVSEGFRGVRLDCIFLDETVATPEIERAMFGTLFVTVGSSCR